LEFCGPTPPEGAQRKKTGKVANENLTGGAPAALTDFRRLFRGLADPIHGRVKSLADNRSYEKRGSSGVCFRDTLVGRSAILRWSIYKSCDRHIEVFRKQRRTSIKIVRIETVLKAAGAVPPVSQLFCRRFSFLERFWQARQPFRYAAYLTPSSPRFRLSSGKSPLNEDAP
jgi:hypothetical protein